MLFGRRVTFALVIIASQILLIALSLTFFTELIMMVKNGAISVVERNWTILIIETVVSAFITVFALVVIVLQTKRLGERRTSDSRVKT